MPALRQLPLPLALLLGWAGCVAPPDDPDPPRACNGSEAFCDRRIDAMRFLVTHNAYCTEADGYLGPNQTHSLRRQLDDGVRGMMLDVHDEEGEPALCHGSCGLGSRPLVDGLLEIKGFLDAHPQEVLLLILERHTSPDAVHDAFEAAGLLDRIWARTDASPWPTLGALADQGTPLLVFDEDPVEGHPWLMHLYAEGWDTDYAARTPEDFSCAPLRGEPGQDLFLLNHFLTFGIGRPDLAAQVNFQPFLGERIAECEAAWGQIVNLLAVDFYEIGDAVQVLQSLNER